MLKILLIMVLFVFGVFAQTLCQQECLSPYIYNALKNQCCTTRWTSKNVCVGGALCDPAGQGNCVV